MQNENEKEFVKKEGTRLVAYLYGELADFAINTDKLVHEIEEKRDGVTDVFFYVNSPGGDVSKGISLFNYLDRNEFNVTWVVDGVAASMAAILLCNPKHRVVMSKFSKLMFHRVQGYVYGTRDEILAAADMVETFENSIIDMFAQKAGITAEKVRAEYFADNLDHWLSAEEAKKKKICDEISESVTVTEAAKALTDATSVYAFYKNQIINKNEQKMKNPSRFATALNLSVQDVENEDLLYEKIQNSFSENSRLKGELDAEKAKTAGLEAKVKAFNEAKVKNLIDTAIAAKKISEDERQSYTELAGSNYEAVEKVLNKAQGVGRVVDHLSEGENGAIPEDLSKKSFDELFKEGKLETVKNKWPEQYKKVFNQKYGKMPVM